MANDPFGSLSDLCRPLSFTSHLCYITFQPPSLFYSRVFSSFQKEALHSSAVTPYFSLPSCPWQLLIYFFVTGFCTLHINGIIKYVAFVSLRIVFLRFLYTAACVVDLMAYEFHLNKKVYIKAIRFI